MSLGRRAAAVSAALDSRIWRQSFINAASERALVLMSLLQSITRLCRQSHHQTSESRTAHRGSGRRVRKGVCGCFPNLFQTRVSIFSPKSTSAARIGSSVTLADCPPRQRSPRQKRLLWVCCYCYSERGYAGNLTIKRQQHNANLPISL